MTKKYQFDTAACHAAWQRITQSSQIALLAHLRPDADALGACSALAHALKKLNKQVEIIYPVSHADAVPFSLENVQVGTHTQTPDLIICCDIASDERAYTPPVFADIPRIIIDHHQDNRMHGMHRFVAPEASSTCEIIAELLATWQQPLDQTMANTLLFGILCDTQSFSTANTSPHTLRIASTLIEAGADLTALNQQRITHSTPAVLKLWGKLLSTLQHTPANNAVWAICTQNDLNQLGLDERALSGFINTLSRTITADVVMLFTQVVAGTKVSLRSKKTDVRAIAAQFGGGGHTLAAGITSTQPVKILEEAIKKLL